MVSALTLPNPAPAALLPRTTALRPVSAGEAGARSGTGPQIEAEALREDELQRLHAPEAESHSPGGDGPEAGRFESAPRHDEERPHPAGETPTFPGGSAAFLAQLLAQDDPPDEPLDPYADASRAYVRLREERHIGLVIDVRDPVDVEV